MLQAAKSSSCCCRSLQGAGLAGRDRSGRLHLLHQVVAPFAFDLEVGAGAEFYGLDQVMIDIGVDARLPERVERSPRRTAADEPGLEILLRRIDELAGLPDVVAVAADQMRAR